MPLAFGALSRNTPPTPHPKRIPIWTLPQAMRCATSTTKSLVLGSGASAGQSYIIHADNVSNLPFLIQTNQDLQMTIGSGKNLIMTNLPTTNPYVAGALWNNSGVLNISS